MQPFPNTGNTGINASAVLFVIVNGKLSALLNCCIIVSRHQLLVQLGDFTAD